MIFFWVKFISKISRESTRENNVLQEEPEEEKKAETDNHTDDENNRVFNLEILA